jgi:hypothetical protein
MKFGAMLMAAALSLAPVAATLADPVVVELTYLGHGQFSFQKKQYDYDALVSAVQAVYLYKHFDGVSVDMGTAASQMDKGQVCPLRQSLQTQVQMFITVDGEKRTFFCN